MAHSLSTPPGPRQEAVIAYGWASPTVGLSAEAQVERIRRFCQAKGWGVASALIPRRFPDLVELTRLATEANIRRVVLTQDVLAELERRYPEVWRDVRARLQARGVSIEPC
jgi:hypothetical protein